MRLPLALALLLCAAPAGAFLFGKSSDEKAAARLAEMRAAFVKGDCAAALAASGPFFGEKPPPALREQAYGYMGSCYETAGSTDKAIALYQLALGLYPENSLFASRLALIYNSAGFPENAAPLFLKALALKPGDPEATLGLARAYAALGFLARAAEFYGKAADIDGYRDARLIEEYALCLLRKRDWAGAEAAAAKGRGVAPLSPAWPRVSARACAGRGDYAGAAAAMEGVLALSPGRQPRLERALYLLLGGRKREAAAAADAELALKPGDPLASQVKGMALYSLGDKAGAAEYFEAARGGGPFTAALAGAFLGYGRPAGEEACRK